MTPARLPPSALLCLSLLAWSATEAATDSLLLEDCRISDAAGLANRAARCGRLMVPEDYDAPDGRQIALFVAVVPALRQPAAAAAFTPIAGGPGAASSEFFVSFGAAFDRIGRASDILLVDQRGTGRSHGLDCPVHEETAGEGWSPDVLRAGTRDCLNSLDGDVRHYTTSAAVRDLDRVREALGYERLDLYGSSYGTRVAQHYMQRYPDRTRTVILDGVVPAGLALGPDIALNAQRALDAILARCAAAPACGERFPELAARLSDLRQRLREAPVPVRLSDPVSGAPLEETLDETDVAVALRLMSYNPDSAALIPLLLDAASGGDYGPIAAQAHMAVKGLSEALSFGMHNSVVCAEDVPFYEADAIDRAALEATYLGTTQLDTLREICALWPRGGIDPDLRQPPEGTHAVLVLSGEMDPVTPPAYGVRVAEKLPNALHVIGPGQGHGIAGVGCVPRLIAEFVAQGGHDGLDFSCLETQGPTPFFLDFAGPGP
jgi:pimeloyl-ACP methyl ester carboxylesterase